MRRIRYSVAMSLDGYIAGPQGEIDWIKTDSDFDFSAYFKQFDTLVAGRSTFQLMAAVGRTSMPGMNTVVVSTTLRAQGHPGIKILPHIEALRDLKANSGKDIWLFGGGKLFRSLAGAGMVDTLEVSVRPILLGSGVPVVPELSKWIDLSLVTHKVYPSGTVSLEYAVGRNTPPESPRGEGGRAQG